MWATLWPSRSATCQNSNAELRTNSPTSKNRSLSATRSVARLTWLISLFPLGIADTGCSKKTPPNVAPTKEASSSIEFIDATEKYGVTSVYQDGSEANANLIVEGLGGGVAMLDFDGDGWLDLIFPGGGKIKQSEPLTGHPTSLWSNRGQTPFVEISTAARIRDSAFYTHGVSTADVNNDGFCDVLLTGFGGLQLFLNQGDGTFTQCASLCGLNDTSWSTSATWIDLNQDGVLDLYVAHYVDWSWSNNPSCGRSAVPDRCTPYDFQGLTDILYLASGDGSFIDITASAGLVEGGKGLGVIAADFNGDQRTDIYVANDTTNNFFYENLGDGKLKEIGMFNGTAVDDRGIPNGSMGIAVTDINLDGEPDLWVTNFENETSALYRNLGSANFQHSSNAYGVNALGKLFVGFGTVTADFDHDGDEDIVVANGHIQKAATLPQEQLLLRNENGKRLLRESFSSGYFATQHLGRGLVTGDLDRDGKLDLVFSNSTEPAAILVNSSNIKSASWIGIRLVGRHSPRDPIGATVVLETNRGKFIRQVCGGGSYLSQNPYSLHWGIPQGTELKSASIHWPSGKKQVASNLVLGSENVILEDR